MGLKKAAYDRCRSGAGARRRFVLEGKGAGMLAVQLSAAGYAACGISVVFLVAGLLTRRRAEPKISRSILAAGVVGTVFMGALVVQAAFVKCEFRAGSCPAPLTGAGYPCRNEGAICDHGNNPQGVKVCKSRTSKWWEYGDCTCDCSDP